MISCLPHCPHHPREPASPSCPGWRRGNGTHWMSGAGCIFFTGVSFNLVTALWILSLCIEVLPTLGKLSNLGLRSISCKWQSQSSGTALADCTALLLHCLPGKEKTESVKKTFGLGEEHKSISMDVLCLCEVGSEPICWATVGDFIRNHPDCSFHPNLIESWKK